MTIPTEPVAGLVPYRQPARWRIRKEWSKNHNCPVYRIERRWWVFWVERGVEFDRVEAKRSLARYRAMEDLRKVREVVAEVDDDGNWSE